MEIPINLLLTISQKKPWMFFPDFIPIGHPIFDIINSTDPEVTKIKCNELPFFQFVGLRKYIFHWSVSIILAINI